MRRLLVAVALLLLCVIPAQSGVGIHQGPGIDVGIGVGPPGGTRYTYYVDSVNGHDTNSGTSPGSAWQHLAKVPVLTTGQSVGLARGSTFTESLYIGIPGTPVNNVTVGAYGTGALPMIDSSSTITNSGANCPVDSADGFTVVFICAATGSGLTASTPYGTYTASGPWINVFECSASPCTPIGAGGHDVPLANETSAANVNTNAGSYFIAGMTGSTAPTSPTSLSIYIHPSAACGNFPNSCTYTFSNRFISLEIDGTGARVNNIACKKNSDNNGCLVQNADNGGATFYGIEADQGGKHNVFCTGGCTIDHATLYDAYYGTNSGNMAVVFDGTSSGLPVSVNNSQFVVGVTTAGISNISAFFAHNNAGTMGAGTFTNDYISFTGASVGLGGGLADIPGTSNTFNGLICSGYIADCISISNTAAVTLENSWFVSSGTAVSVNLLTFPSSGNVTVTNTTSCVASAHGGGNILTNSAGATLSISGSDLITLDGGAPVYSGGTGTLTLSITGTTMTGPTTGNNSGETIYGTGNSFTGSNNTYSTSIDRWTWNGTGFPSNVTLAEWQTSTGSDTGSVWTGANATGCPTLPTWSP